MDTAKIGRFIAQCRKTTGITQVQLAEKLGVTGKTVSRWENGNYMPDLSLLQPLATELGITLNELLRGEYLTEKATVEKAETTLRQAVDYSDKKLKKERNTFYITSRIVAVFVVVFCYGYYLYTDLQFTFSTAEECRNTAFSYYESDDSQIVYSDRTLNGEWYQICFYADSENIGITVIEKYRNRYRILPGTGTHYAMLSNPPVRAYLHIIYDNPGNQNDLYIMWNYTAEDISAVKIKDTTYTPRELENGCKVWFAPVNSWWLMNNIEYIYQ